MSTYGSHPEQMTVKLTLGDGTHLVATSANGWAGPVSLVWGPDDGVWTEETSTLTDPGTIDGTEVSWTLTAAEVTARAAFPYVRLVDNGMTLKAGEVILWRGGLGSTVTQTIASLTAGPPGPTAVSADADNVATLGSDGLIYVSPADTGGFSDAAVAAFVADDGSSTYASILAGFAATDDPRLSDARTPTAHGHPISDVTNLQTTLDGKAAASHTHDVGDLDATGTADSTTYLRGDGTWATPAGGGGGLGDVGAAIWDTDTFTYPTRPGVPLVIWRGPVDPRSIAESGFIPTVDLWAPSDAAASDATPPTPGDLAASDITDTGFTLTVTGAVDDMALDAEPYRFSIDDGETWSDWQASNVFVVADATPGTGYSCVHEVRDAGGLSAAGEALPVVTTGGSGGAAPAIDFTDSAVDGSNTATHTYSGLDFGSAHADRHVIVCVGWGASPPRALTSATIGGVAATIDQTSDASGTGCAAIIRAAVPTGATGTVVLNWVGSIARSGIGVYASQEAVGVAAVATLAGDGGSTALATATITNPTDGHVIASGYTFSTTPEWSANVTQDHASTIETVWATSAHTTTTGALTIHPHPTSGSTSDACVAVAYTGA